MNGNTAMLMAIQITTKPNSSGSGVAPTWRGKLKIIWNHNQPIGYVNQKNPAT